MVTAYGLVLWSMTRAPVAAVAALRETSVVFAALIGARLLREPVGSFRAAAAAVVAAGAALLEL
jgi:drug/metabolite transporter (DMT)-like permease